MIKKHLKALNFKSFEEHRKIINQENATGVELILFFETVILVLNLAGEIAKRQNLLQMHSLMAQVIYVGVALLLYVFILRKRETNYTFWIYLLEIPMLAITMISGTVGKPGELTFTFLFLLLLLPILILDKPWRVILFVLGIGCLYAVLDASVKGPALFSRDLIHLLNVMMMSVAASLFTSSVRIQNIEYTAYFAEKADRDPLTGLYNRSGYEHRFDPDEPGILVYLDLDQFKQVNDLFGHAEGDQVLIRTAEVLRSCFRSNDIIVRMGGDEFAVYAPGQWEQTAIRRKLVDIQTRIKEIRSSDSSGHTVTMSASIGCVYAPEGCETLDLMVRLADQEMYRVKQHGKDNYSLKMI